LEVLLVEDLSLAMVGFDLCLERCGPCFLGREIILR
jgi:hypothetical protein